MSGNAVLLLFTNGKINVLHLVHYFQIQYVICYL